VLGAEFIELCTKIVGYDAIVMVDSSSSSIKRYCHTHRILMFNGTILSDKYGHTETSGMPYCGLPGTKVLFCDTSSIYEHVKTPKCRLLNSIKDFK